MRTRFVVVMVLALSLVAAACGDDEGGDGGGEGCAIDQLNLVESGMLTIATGNAVFPPWMLNDDPTSGEGFESAVAYAIAEQMGFTDDQVRWTGTEFDEAITAGAKDWDFNIQQYSITEERDEVVDFSRGYYTVKQALVANPGSGIEGATSADDLKDAKLGAAVATTSLDYIEEVIAPDQEAAVYNTNADAISALNAGQIDGIVVDLPTAFFITAVQAPEATIVGQFEDPGGEPDELGLLFEEGNSLVDCVDVAIEALQDDGTLATLEEQWLSTETEVRVITP